MGGMGGCNESKHIYLLGIIEWNSTLYRYVIQLYSTLYTGLKVEASTPLITFFAKAHFAHMTV